MLTRRPRKRRWGNELERARHARLADFAMRSEPSSPPDESLPVTTIAGTSSRYIAVHLFAGETIPPSKYLPAVVVGQSVDAWYVDAHVTDGRDVCFAQMETARSARCAPRLDTSWWHDDPPRLHLRTIVDADEITRRLFESWLVAIVTHRVSNEPVGPPRTRKPIPLLPRTE